MELCHLDWNPFFKLLLCFLRSRSYHLFHPLPLLPLNPRTQVWIFAKRMDAILNTTSKQELSKCRPQFRRDVSYCLIEGWNVCNYHSSIKIADLLMNIAIGISIILPTDSSFNSVGLRKLLGNIVTQTQDCWTSLKAIFLTSLLNCALDILALRIRYI